MKNAKCKMTNNDIELLRKFVAEIERRAEDKMLKTGKLEGAHYAAMKQVFKEWTDSPTAERSETGCGEAKPKH